MRTWRDVQKELQEANEKALLQLKRRDMIGPYEMPIEMITNMLRDKNPEKRSVAVAGLAMRATRDCDPSILFMLLPTLHDPEKRNAINAATAFGACGYERAIDGMIELMLSPKMTAEEIDHLGYSICGIGKPAVPALLKVMGSNNKVAGKAAGSSLFNMGPEVIEWILDRVRDDTNEDYIWGLAVLAKFGKISAHAIMVRMKNEETYYNPELKARLFNMFTMLAQLSER